MKNKEPPLSEEIICAEYKSVFRYVMTLCKNQAEAEDITQEAFLKAIRYSDKFLQGSSLYTWLCTIARNTWLNRIKSSKKETMTDNIEEASEKSVQELEELVADKDAAFHIHKALHEISEPYKEVFSLRVFGELSFKEIARLFSKTESWARVTFYRAKKIIIEKLRKDGFYE